MPGKTRVPAMTWAGESDSALQAALQNNPGEDLGGLHQFINRDEFIHGVGSQKITSPVHNAR